MLLLSYMPTVLLFMPFNRFTLTPIKDGIDLYILELVNSKPLENKSDVPWFDLSDVSCYDLLAYYHTFVCHLQQHIPCTDTTETLRLNSGESKFWRNFNKKFKAS